MLTFLLDTSNHLKGDVTLHLLFLYSNITSTVIVITHISIL